MLTVNMHFEITYDTAKYNFTWRVYSLPEVDCPREVVDGGRRSSVVRVLAD